MLASGQGVGSRSRWVLAWYWLGGVLVCSLGGNAGAGELLLDDQQDRLLVSAYLEFLRDPTGGMGLGDVLASQGRFTSGGQAMEHAFTPDAIWTRLELRNGSRLAQSWILEIANARLQEVDLYLVGRDGVAIDHQELRFDEGFYERMISAPRPAFSIRMAPRDSLTVFLRTRSKTAHFLPVLLSRESTWYAGQLRRAGIEGGVLAAIVTSLVFLTLFAIAAHQAGLLFLGGYIGLMGLLVGTIDGTAYELLWPDSPWWALRSTPVIGFAALAMAGQAASFLLETPGRNFVRSEKVMGALTSSAAVAALAALFGPFHLFAEMLPGAFLAGNCLLVVIALSRIKSGARAAGFFALSLVATTLSLLDYSMWAMNWSTAEAPMDTFFPSVGLLVAALALGTALASRVRQLWLARAEESRALERESMAARALEKNFQRFLPMPALELLNKPAPWDFRLGDRRLLSVAVLFLDVRDFTSRCERYRTQESFDFVNFVFGEMAPIIRGNRGFVCRYIGDAMLCAFPHGGEDALRAALQLREAIDRIDCQDAGDARRESFRAGIGVHYGEVQLGIVGEAQRMEVAIVGDTVNTAKRIESLTKTYNKPVLVSGDCLSNLGAETAFEVEFVARQQLPGRSSPTTLFILHGEKASAEKLDAPALAMRGADLQVRS